MNFYCLLNRKWKSSGKSEAIIVYFCKFLLFAFCEFCLCLFLLMTIYFWCFWNLFNENWILLGIVWSWDSKWGVDCLVDVHKESFTHYVSPSVKKFVWENILIVWSATKSRTLLPPLLKHYVINERPLYSFKPQTPLYP